MNASASALPRENEVQSKIRKVRQFGRIARVVCAAFFGFGLVGSLFLLVIFGFTTHISEQSSGKGGAYDILSALLTPLQLKVCVSLAMGVLIGLWLAAVYQLYRLFGNLAAGAIYTPENVRRVRHVGLLMLLLAVVGIVVPAALVVAHGFFDAPVPIDLDRVLPSLPKLLSDFIAAGLILLASWIMDVGLYEKDHADALKRDADLVI